MYKGTLQQGLPLEKQAQTHVKPHTIATVSYFVLDFNLCFYNSFPSHQWPLHYNGPSPVFHWHSTHCSSVSVLARLPQGAGWTHLPAWRPSVVLTHAGHTHATPSTPPKRLALWTGTPHWGGIGLKLGGKPLLHLCVERVDFHHQAIMQQPLLKYSIVVMIESRVCPFSRAQS